MELDGIAIIRITESEMIGLPQSVVDINKINQGLFCQKVLERDSNPGTKKRKFLGEINCINNVKK